MMNYIWGGMLLLGIIFATINGKASEFTDGLMNSCTEAVTFVIGLAGIMAVWSGIMKIAEESGLIKKISDLASPIITFLFPEINNSKAKTMIIMSFVTNLFGAGNSSTVFSLKAMELLDEDNNQSIYASNSMCMFMALNMSMIQLIPITIIKIRNDLGSVYPEDIIIPSILSGLLSMVISVWICKYYERKPTCLKY